MPDLFAERRESARKRVEPLALRMRPRTLSEVAGQRHIIGEGRPGGSHDDDQAGARPGLLRRMIAADAITSLILHGPPGTGKTTLAEVIANATKRHFVRENAAAVGVARIREVIQQATARIEDAGPRTILFLDEIHRFSKSQQDVLLGDVERGLITLVGATTENPMFACNAALVSRSTLFRLEPLTEQDVIVVLKRAAADRERGFGSLTLDISDEAYRVWAVKCDGDARRALTALEVAVLSRLAEFDGPRAQAGVIVIDRDIAEDSIQQKLAAYSAGDEHYDAASAMIKSVRGGDPDAALYWMARMLESGEDPRFIARRLAILASEDIGNADPRGVEIARAGWELAERIGMPEARITLAQVATYLACAPKSNASYLAINAAAADVRDGRTLPVPMYIQDKNTLKGVHAVGVDAPANTRGVVSGGKRTGKLAKAKGYQYSHDGVLVEAGGEQVQRITSQDYLGVERTYYQPTEHGEERAIKQRLDAIRTTRRAVREQEST